jgi:hypothetical protein
VLKGSLSTKHTGSDPSKLIEFVKKDTHRIGSNLLRESCKAKMNSLNVETIKMAEQRCVDTDYERTTSKKQLKSPVTQERAKFPKSPRGSDQKHR